MVSVTLSSFIPYGSTESTEIMRDAGWRKARSLGFIPYGSTESTEMLSHMNTAVPLTLFHPIRLDREH